MSVSFKYHKTIQHETALVQKKNSEIDGSNNLTLLKLHPARVQYTKIMHLYKIKILYN